MALSEEEHPLKEIRTHFANLQDPRIERTKVHQLLDIITIAICAVICGADSWVEMEEFGNAKRTWFETFLLLPSGIPSHDTFGRVFARINPAQFQEAFLEWVQSVVSFSKGQVVAIDGKRLRHSYDKTNGKAAISMVSAWATHNRMVLGQVKVDDKSNEITAIPALLEVLDLAGCIVTIDAMGCQTAIAQSIADKGADYVLSLKGNQDTIHTDVMTAFSEAHQSNFEGIAHGTRETLDKNHGRVERRQAWLIHDKEYLDYLNPSGKWAQLGGIGAVTAWRYTKTGRDKTDTGDGEPSTQVQVQVSQKTRYFLTSLTDVSKFAEAVRAHWGIENGLHWVLDIAFREDESRIRKDYSAQNFAVLRHIALNLLKQETSAKRGIKTKRLRAGWDHDYLLKLLLQ